MKDASPRPFRACIYMEMTIHRLEQYKDTKLSAPAVEAAGGRHMVAGVRPEVIEGTFDAHRVVIVAFDSAGEARRFSAAYQAAKAKRQGAADFKMLSLEG